MIHYRQYYIPKFNITQVLLFVIKKTLVTHERFSFLGEKERERERERKSTGNSEGTNKSQMTRSPKQINKANIID